MAVGVIAVLKAAGRSVPEDVSVAGYDDSAVASLFDPPLTTVVNPVAQLSRAAGLVLLDRILAGRPVGPPSIFPPELIIRASG